MPEQTPKMEFLIEYILKLLEDNNIELTDEQKDVYVPQVLSQLELRLGLELMPKLNEENKKKMDTMMGDESLSGQDWANFWKEAVPDYEEAVKKVLEDFSSKFKEMAG